MIDSKKIQALLQFRGNQEKVKEFQIKISKNFQ